MRGDLLLRPLVVFDRADDELDFVSGFELREVAPAIPFDLATAGAFQIHDPAHARIHLRNVKRAAGFEEHG